MRKVTLLGLGIMGTGMGQNLLKAGFPLTIYNRTRSKAAPLTALGAQVAGTPREAAEDAEVILSMVGDDDASRAVWLGSDGALAGAAANAVLIECSTLSIAWIRELAGQVGARPFLDSPVGGSKAAAEAGKLRLFVGGEAAALAQAQSVLESISQSIAHMGPLGSGTLMKLINNMMAAVQVVALAEGLNMAERAGLNRQRFVEQITDGAVASPIVKGKMPRMVARNYDDTEFALRWMHKDTTYALRAADEVGSSLFTAAVAREVLMLARNAGLGDADFSAVIEVFRQATNAAAPK